MSNDKKPSAPAAKEQMVTVRVLRDFWTDSGNPDFAERIKKGTIVDVPVSAALDGIENGSLSRVRD